MTDHQEALSWARKQLGKKEVPFGSNTGPFVISCQRATWLAGTGWPWCVAFCQKAWLQAGAPLPYRGAGAYALLDWAKAHGATVTLGTAKPGDIVVWNVGSGHASLLERFDPHTQQVHSVDGNVSDQVARKVRSASLVRGVVAVKEAAKKPAPKLPVFEVVRSESGHQMVVFVGGKSKVLQWLKHHTIKDKTLTIRRKK